MYTEKTTFNNINTYNCNKSRLLFVILYLTDVPYIIRFTKKIEVF